MAEAISKGMLKQHFHEIARNIDLPEVLPLLITYGCISRDQRNMIMEKRDKKSQYSGNELLLNILMGQNEKHSIEKLIQALESTGQVELAGLLKSTGPNETISKLDQRKIQSNFHDLTTRMRTSEVVDILIEERDYFTGFELQDLQSKPTDKQKADHLILEVINKGTYKHLHQLKKALIQIGQVDLAKYLPVTVQTDVYGKELKDGILIILVRVVCKSDIQRMRSELITKFMDPTQDLNKEVSHMYLLKNITAEASISSEDSLNLYLKLKVMSKHSKIVEDIRNGHLEKVIKQHSYLTTKASWSLVFQLQYHNADDDDNGEKSFHMTHQGDNTESHLQSPQFASSQLSSVPSTSVSRDSSCSSTSHGYGTEKINKNESIPGVKLTSGTRVSNASKHLDKKHKAHAAFKPSPTATRNQGHLKEQTFYTIHEKDCTPYDFGQAISNCKQANVASTDIKTLDGLNILHTCIDKGRLSYLPILVIVGWWNILSKEKVAENSPHEHKGKTAKQIAESKRAKKPLAEFNSANEWDTSLSPLMKACRSGDLSRARQLIQEGGEEIFYCDYNGGNALFWAVIYGDVNLIEDLLQMGVDPTVRTKKKENLLHVACLVGNSNVIHKLLTNSLNIDPWLQDNTSKAPLDRNAENGDISTLIKFVEKGIKPKPNSVPLCAFVGRKVYLEYLLDTLKMAVDSEDIYSRSALHRACEGNKMDIVRLLLKKKANITKITCTARSLIHILAENGSMELMLMILSLFRERGILDRFISAQDRYNGVELCFLIRGRDKGRDAWHYVEVKRYLVPVFLVKTKSGNVDVACYGEVINSGWGVNPSQDVIEEIEQMFKDRRLNHLAAADMTPLHIAIFKGHEEVAKVLIENGANVNIKDSFGNSPLMIAASKGNLELVRVLEGKGANFNDVNADGKGISDIGDENQHEDIVNYVKGRDFREVTKNFCQGKISHLENQLASSHLDSVRRSGGDVKRDIIDTLRNFRIDINQFLVDIGSGPVLEASDNDGPAPLSETTQLQNR